MEWKELHKGLHQEYAAPRRPVNCIFEADVTVKDVVFTKQTGCCVMREGPTAKTSRFQPPGFSFSFFLRF